MHANRATSLQTSARSRAKVLMSDGETTGAKKSLQKGHNRSKRSLDYYSRRKSVIVVRKAEITPQETTMFDSPSRVASPALNGDPNQR